MVFTGTKDMRRDAMWLRLAEMGLVSQESSHWSVSDPPLTIEPSPAAGNILEIFL
jgi:hypothetical protein